VRRLPSTAISATRSRAGVGLAYKPQIIGFFVKQLDVVRLTILVVGFFKGVGTSKGTAGHQRGQATFFCLISASHLARVGPVDAWYFQVQIDLRFSSASLFLQKVFGDSLIHESKPAVAADNGSSTCVSQFASTSTGQASANSLRRQLHHGQSLTEATRPDLTGFCRT
jgi:hypothetical protein